MDFINEHYENSSLWTCNDKYILMLEYYLCIKSEINITIIIRALLWVQYKEINKLLQHSTDTRHQSSNISIQHTLR